jgi:hypothetical protein
VTRLAVDSRLLGAGLLAAIAAVTVLVATRPPETTSVVVVADPVAAGTPVHAIELEERPVTDSTGLVPAADLDLFVDHVLLVDLAPGDPVFQSALSAPETASESDVMGVELPSAAAVHGALVAGDEVDVYLVSDPAVPIATSVTVVAALTDGGSLGTGDVGLLLAVDDALAASLVEAISTDSVHLVRSGH